MYNNFFIFKKGSFNQIPDYPLPEKIDKKMKAHLPGSILKRDSILKN